MMFEEVVLPSQLLFLLQYWQYSIRLKCFQVVSIEICRRIDDSLDNSEFRLDS